MPGAIFVDRGEVVDALQAVPLILAPAAPGLIAGLAGRPLLGLLWATALALIGVITTVTEPPNYDMPGFDLYFYGAGAAIAILGLLAGLGVRRARRRRLRRDARP